MASRVRTRRTGPTEGSFEQRSGTNYFTTDSDSYSYRGTCTDLAGVRDNAFEVDYQVVNGHVLTHTFYLNPEKTQYRRCLNWPTNYWKNSAPSLAHQAISGRPPNGSMAVRLLAATNPSKPVVDLPVSLLELRELPHLLKTTGDTLIKTFAKKNLNREFGLTPLMADFIAIVTMQKQITERIKLFKALREKPLLRKANLWDGSVTTEPGTVYPTNSAPAFLVINHRAIQLVTTDHTWGYVTWTPDDAFRNDKLTYSDPGLDILARRAVYGTQLGLVTAWNALPWTWLFDWFGDIGDWLEANRHVVPATPGIPRICRTLETKLHCRVESSNMGLTQMQMPITVHRVTKTRSLVSATLPSAYLPLLTERQIGILASLAILRL